MGEEDLVSDKSWLQMIKLMKISSKLKASIFVLVTTLIMGSCVAIALTNTS